MFNPNTPRFGTGDKKLPVSSLPAADQADARAQEVAAKEAMAQAVREQEVATIDAGAQSVPQGDLSATSRAVTLEASSSQEQSEYINQRELLNGAKVAQIQESDVFDVEKKHLLERAGTYAQGHGMDRLKNNQELQGKMADALEKFIKADTADALPDTELAPLAKEVGMTVKEFRSQLESLSQELLNQAEKAVAVEDITARGPVPDTFWGKVGDISKKALKGIGITSGYAAGSIGISLAVTKGAALIGLGALGALPASIIVGGGFLALRIVKSRKKSQETQQKIEQKQKELRAAFQSTPEVMQTLNALIVSKNQEQIDSALEEIVETEIHVGTRDNLRNLRTATATETDERRKELHQKKKDTLKNKIITYLVEGQGMESAKAEIIAYNAMGLQTIDERSQEIEKELDPLWARFGKKLEQYADVDIKNKTNKHLMRMGLARIGIGIGVTLFGDRDLGSRLIGATFAGLGGRSIGEVAFRAAQRKMARPELTAQRFDEVMSSNATAEEKQKLYLEARALFADTRKREALEKSDPTRYAELKIRVEKETIRQFQAMLSHVQEKNNSLGRHVESGVQIAAVKNKIDEITSGTRAAKHAEQKRETQEQATRAATQLAIGAAVSVATWYLTPAVRQFARDQITNAARFVIEHSNTMPASYGAGAAMPLRGMRQPAAEEHLPTPSAKAHNDIQPRHSRVSLREMVQPDKPTISGYVVRGSQRFDQIPQATTVGTSVETPTDDDLDLQDKLRIEKIKQEALAQAQATLDSITYPDSSPAEGVGELNRNNAWDKNRDSFRYLGKGFEDIFNHIDTDKDILMKLQKGEIVTLKVATESGHDTEGKWRYQPGTDHKIDFQPVSEDGWRVRMCKGEIYAETPYPDKDDFWRSANNQGTYVFEGGDAYPVTPRGIIGQTGEVVGGGMVYKDGHDHGVMYDALGKRIEQNQKGLFEVTQLDQETAGEKVYVARHYNQDAPFDKTEFRVVHQHEQGYWSWEEGKVLPTHSYTFPDGHKLLLSHTEGRFWDIAGEESGGDGIWREHHVRIQDNSVEIEENGTWVVLNPDKNFQVISR